MIDNLIMSVYQTLEKAQATFEKKAHDYGTNWRIYRIISVADQILIKARRIGKISGGVQKVNNVGDDIESEFLGMINYSIMGVIQNRLGNWEGDPKKALLVSEAIEHYRSIVLIFNNYINSQHSYYLEEIVGWSTKKYSDLLAQKIHRLKSLSSNKKDEDRILIFGSFLDILVWSVVGHANYKATQ